MASWVPPTAQSPLNLIVQWPQRLADFGPAFGPDCFQALLDSAPLPDTNEPALSVAIHVRTAHSFSNPSHIIEFGVAILDPLDQNLFCDLRRPLSWADAINVVLDGPSHPSPPATIGSIVRYTSSDRIVHEAIESITTRRSMNNGRRRPMILIGDDLPNALTHLSKYPGLGSKPMFQEPFWLWPVEATAVYLGMVPHLLAIPQLMTDLNLPTHDIAFTAASHFAFQVLRVAQRLLAEMTQRDRERGGDS